MASTWHESLKVFAAESEVAFGRRLHGVFLFGSRARGEHVEESDADVAVVLSDDGFDFWRLKEEIGDLAYRRLLADGLYIQAMPFSLAQWNDPAARSFLDSVKADARSVAAAA